MVTFTLPQELRVLFLGANAARAYRIYFAAVARALRQTLADPRWLGVHTPGFSAILHTWNQRLLFHPHIHCIVPGVGLDAAGRVITVKNANFLVPQPALCRAFRRCFQCEFEKLKREDPASVPEIDPAVWTKDWGVHLQAFGNGAHAVRYLGAYVCRTAIRDSRITALSANNVSFRWKDRSKANAIRTETIDGIEFVRRYLRHVLPPGMQAIRRYGFCQPAAKRQRELITAHTGGPSITPGTKLPPAPTPPKIPLCPCCGSPMAPILRLLPSYRATRAPPQISLQQCA